MSQFPSQFAAAAGRPEQARGLLNSKDTSVGDIPENISKGDFQKWRAHLELHLESTPGWMGVTPLLKAIRLEQEAISLENVDVMMVEMTEAGNLQFEEEFDTRKRGRELYV